MQGKIIYSFNAHALKNGMYYVTIQLIGANKENSRRAAEAVSDENQQSPRTAGDRDSYAKNPTRARPVPSATEAEPNPNPNHGSTANDGADNKKDNLGQARLVGPTVDNRSTLIQPAKRLEKVAALSSRKLDTFGGGSAPENVAAGAQLLQTRTGKGVLELLASGDPITLFAEPDPEKIDASRSTIKLGKLTVIAPSSGDSATDIADDSHNGTFEIVYRRPDVPLHDIADTGNLRADDAAIVLRVFMLSKLAAARIEMRGVLLDLANKRRTIDRLCKTCNAKTSSIVKKRAAARALRRLWFQLRAKDSHSAPVKGAIHHAIVALESRVANWTAILHTFTARHKGWFFLTSLFVLAGAVCWVWIPYWGDYHSGSVGGWLLLALICGGALFFLMNALNLRSVEQKLEECVHEHVTEKLNIILASVVQINANVVCGNFEHRYHAGFAPSAVPEMLLYKMDQTLHLKDRLSSFAEAIKARQTHVAEGVAHLQAHRDRVRRSITAAGSGVFVGFFTYEVGESVMKYLHQTHKQDPSAMLYYLFERAKSPRQGEASAGTVNPEPTKARDQSDKSTTAKPAAGRPPAADLKREQVATSKGLVEAPMAARERAGRSAAADLTRERVVPSKGSLHAPAAAPAQASVQASEVPPLDRTFVDAYHRPELFAHSLLLTITIIVSALTAWIVMRKPAAEQSVLHGHH